MSWLTDLRHGYRARGRRLYRIEGDTAGSEHGVIERLGLDEHRPVRPPQKWREVRILGGTVYVRGHDNAPCLLECCNCACLVVGDRYAMARHRELCIAALPGQQRPGPAAAHGEPLEPEIEGDDDNA